MNGIWRIQWGVGFGAMWWVAACGGYPMDERVHGDEGAYSAALVAEPVPNEKLPPVCGQNVPPVQSPAVFGPTGIMPQVAESCTPGTDFKICHEHLHCGDGKQKTEHSGAGICGTADCEIHTVYRKPKAGGVAADVAKPHEGTVADNCKPGTHDIVVKATFLDWDEGCKPGNATLLTYCGSSTGNHEMDKNHDGVATCQESGLLGTVVRWCIETQCMCGPEENLEEAEDQYGENEPLRVQGCPGPTPQCKPEGKACEFNYNPNSITIRHCCQAAPLCVVPQGAIAGVCKKGDGAKDPPAQCVPEGGACTANYDPSWLTNGHCCFTAKRCVVPFGAKVGVCKATK